MTRTYIPQLRIVVRAVHRYATRWQSALEGTLTPAQYTCLLALISAAIDCLNALGEETPSP